LDSQKVNQEGYDKLASWWKTERDKSFVSKLITDLVDVLPKKAKILDIGCGTGYPIASFLTEQGYHVTGIDSSKIMIDFAMDLKLPNATFHHVDFFDFEPSNTFDAIIAWDSLWHLPYERQLEIYPIISSWMNQDGYFIFTAGDADDFHVSENMGAPIYHAAKPKEEVWQALKCNGVSIIYTYLDFKEKSTDRGMVILGKKGKSAHLIEIFKR
jgi:SAM-dependent methyltransferase